MKKGSLSTWFLDAKGKEEATFSKEDESKGERLNLLNSLINFPINSGLKMSVKEFLLIDHESDLKILEKPLTQVDLGVRVIPGSDSDKIMRLRGKKYDEIQIWMTKESLNENRMVYILPHVDNPTWSTIFVVNENGITGEAIEDAPHILTQGLESNSEIIQFFYDFDKIGLSSPNQDLTNHLIYVFSYLKLFEEQQLELSAKLRCNFYQGFLAGYFETVYTDRYGLWFIDFNRVLESSFDYSLIRETSEQSENVVEISGIPVSKGKIIGVARLIKDENDFDNFRRGEILICDMTTPDFISIMKMAGGIVTKLGGMLSHAAIISRELDIPCISGIGDSINKIEDGTEIELDSTNGKILISKI